MDEKSWWDQWNTSYRVNDSPDAVAGELFARAAALINEITRAGRGRVLEVACGTGILSRMLVYSSYHGLDISPAAIDVARQKSEKTPRPAAAALPTYEVADFHDWPLPDQPFDVTVCVDAISSFRDQPLVMNKFAQSLGTQGRLVLTTINRFIYQRIRRSGGVRLESGPVSHWLSRGELNSLVRQAGLMIETSATIMPRGNMGFLRLLNSPRLNEAFGPRFAALLKRAKEQIGLGQYSVVVARKAG
jgi:SAM-dependent methyltransferase